MLYNCLAVGAGGALGAAARYLVGLIPLLHRGAFPLPTLLINLAGAVVIGVVAAAGGRTALSPTALLFLQVGVCGGFTTFSTFSLESLVLLEDGHTGLFALYAAASVGLCLLGVWLAMIADWVVRAVFFLVRYLRGKWKRIKVI